MKHKEAAISPRFLVLADYQNVYMDSQRDEERWSTHNDYPSAREKIEEHLKDGASGIELFVSIWRWQPK
jgi:hypothetical protein